MKAQVEFVTKENLINEDDIGNLVPLKCGHRGKPNPKEEKLLDSLLRDSLFLQGSFWESS